MRRIALLASIVVLVPQVATAHVVRHRNIPQAYQGTWATAAASCGVDKGAIVLAAGTYTSRDKNCTVVYLDETAGAQGPNFSARLLCSDSAGGAKKSAVNLIIRPDKDGISVGPAFDSLVAYQRCLSNGADAKH